MSEKMDLGADEYFINFDTRIEPGKMVATRVRIDQVTITDMSTKMRIDLCDHPLYKDLRDYVEANK